MHHRIIAVLRVVVSCVLTIFHRKLRSVLREHSQGSVGLPGCSQKSKKHLVRLSAPSSASVLGTGLEGVPMLG